VTSPKAEISWDVGSELENVETCSGIQREIALLKETDLQDVCIAISE
jgi:hypothetical protein